MSDLVKDKDLGFKDFVETVESLYAKTLKVGIMDKSPRAQFRLGTDQEFRAETAGLLLRKPIDGKREILINRLKRIARKALLKDADLDKELKKLGEDIKFDMGLQTDPPPQLRNAIIVEIEDA